MVDQFRVLSKPEPSASIRKTEEHLLHTRNLRDKLAEVVDALNLNVYPQLRKLESEIDGKAASSHTHDAGDIASGTVATARLGSGTASSSTFLRGDQAWATPSTDPDIDGTTETTDPPDLNDDDLLIYDGSAAANRKITFLNARRRTTGTLAATGTTSGGAATVLTELTQITSADVNNVGVILDGWGDGTLLLMENTSARTITIYPHAGGTINGGASVTLASGVFCLVWQDTNDWRKVDI